MNALDAFIRDKLQRAALYGRDHYNIPVAFWAYACVIICLCSMIARLLTIYIFTDTPFSIMMMCGIIALLYFVLYIPSTQLLEYEQKGKYELYEKLRAKFETDIFLRYLTITVGLPFLSITTYKYYHNQMDGKLYALLFIDNITYCTHVFARCLHTRPRDPPGKTNLSFNPA